MVYVAISLFHFHLQYGSHDTLTYYNNHNKYNTLPKLVESFQRGEGDGAVVPDEPSSGGKSGPRFPTNSPQQNSPNHPPGNCHLVLVTSQYQFYFALQFNFDCGASKSGAACYLEYENPCRFHYKI